jgi:predicted transposase YbfD/YdcC
MLSPPQYQTIDKGHGRLEIRQIWTSTILNDYLTFPHLQQVICIKREVTYFSNHKKSQETVYAITSLSPEKASPQQLLELNRGHWSIENQLHYVRDVAFGEDRSQIRSGNAPQVMATLRNLVIGIFRWLSITNISQELRRLAAKPHLALRFLGL